MTGGYRVVKCPICEHPNRQVIEADLTKGVDFPKITRKFKITQDDIVTHIQHGLGDTEESDDQIGKLLSQSTDEFSILKFNLFHLRNRYTNLILADPASAESKELISLSKAMNETVKTLLVVRKEIGQVDDTRVRELEKMFGQLMMTLPTLCEKDQAIVENTLGIAAIVD